MEKPKRPNFPSHRRPGSISWDVKKSSSSLNMSTSSLQSISEDMDTTARRPAVVRFAPPPSSSVAAKARRSSIPASQQAAMAPATSAARRPASSCGQRPSRSSGARSLPLPAESGPKTLRRSWGWTGSAGGHKQETENGDPRSQGTASSVPRRMAKVEKPLQKTESKEKTTSRTKAGSSNLSPKPDVLLKVRSAQRSPNIAGKPGHSDEKDTPSSLSLDNMVIRVSPSPSRTSSTTPSASWESLPSDLKTLGSEVMSYKDAAEMAAVEAMQEASAAEIVLRCLSAFADLTASAAKQPPQHTVDGFLSLEAAISRSAAVLGNHQKRRSGSHADDWLRAAVTANLAPFSLYRNKKKHGAEEESPAARFSSASPLAAGEEAAAPEEEMEMEITWLEAAARRLGEEMSAWFAGHVEGLVDSDVAGTLGQLKRVNDWLDKDDAGSRRPEAAERLRKKIFGYLLDHVESAVVALNGGAAPNRGKSNSSAYSVS